MAIADVTPPQGSPYPVRLTMEYQEKLSRLSTAFRIILLIPLAIFVAFLTGGGGFPSADAPDGGQSAGFGAGAAGAVVLAIWAAIIVRGYIPRWLFNFQVALHRFVYRAYAYFGLLTDRYPAFEGDWLLQFDVDYPERPSRWKVIIFKGLASIPHAIILFFLVIASLFIILIGWFAILFTGAFPRGLHAFVVGVLRWGARVTAYFESLTDAFPPYSLDDDAPAGSRDAETISAIIGGAIIAIAIAAGIAIGIVLYMYFTDSKDREVSLDAVVSGDVADDTVEMDGVRFTLLEGSDPADVDALAAPAAKRLVEFTVRYELEEAGEDFDLGEGAAKSGDDEIARGTLRLKTSDDNSVRPELLTFDGVAAPLDVDEGDTGELRGIFEVDEDTTLQELRAYPNSGNNRRVTWKFR